MAAINSSNDNVHLFKEWYFSIPPVTRTIMTAILAVSAYGNLLGGVGLLYFDYHLAFFQLQLWRTVTCFFYGAFGMNFLIQMFFLFQYSKGLESSYFSGKTADHAYCLIVMCSLLLVFGSLFETPFMMHPFMLAMVYVWAQSSGETTVTFYFGLQFKAMYLPLVLAAFDLLTGSFSVATIYANFVGHIYWYLQEIYPQSRGPNAKPFLQTPAFLERYLQQPGADGQVPVKAGGFFGGGGHRLGSK